MTKRIRQPRPRAALPWAVGMGDHAGNDSTARTDATTRPNAPTEVQRGQIDRECCHGVGAVRDA